MVETSGRENMTDFIGRQADRRFEEAHRRALIRAIVDTVRRQPNEMLSFAEVRARLNVRGQRYIGHQTVLLDHIVGSEGRYDDFDRRFLPRSRSLKARWSGITRAMMASRELPPIELYRSAISISSAMAIIAFRQRATRPGVYRCVCDRTLG